MSTEAMKLALEALESCDTGHITDGSRQWYDERLVDKAITALDEALAQPAQQEPVAGCVCRWNSEGDRVVTCERHQGWLEVIAEWADRAREAEKKLKFLMNTSPPAQPQPEPVAWIPIITWRWNNNAGTWEGLTNTSPPARKPLTEPQKQALAENWFAEDWAITKAIGMMYDHEKMLGIKGDA